MRKELHELQEIDRYILQELPVTDRLVFQARMLVSPALRKKLKQQQKAHQMVRWYGRDLQREKLAAIHNQLMADTNFSRLISSIFK